MGRMGKASGPSRVTLGFDEVRECCPFYPAQSPEFGVIPVELIKGTRHPFPRIVIMPDNDSAAMAQHGESPEGIILHIVRGMCSVDENKIHSTRIRGEVKPGRISVELADFLLL